MWEVVLVLLGGAAFLYKRAERNLRRLWLWQDAASSCGLRALESAYLHPRLMAQAGPFDVQIEASGSRGHLTRIKVTGPGSQRFQEVNICRERLFQRPQEIEIGDESFDRTFHIEGPMRLVFALLDAATRRLLLSANSESRLEISNGVLQAEIQSDEVDGIVGLLLDISKQIAQAEDVPRRLMDNATQDPEIRVRLQNLLVLSRELPGDPVTIETLRKACSDPSPEIRLRAAKELGAEGREVLLELAESTENDAVSAAAVAALGRELPFERTTALLDRALSERRIQTARACVEALGRSGAAPAVEMLAKVVTREKSGLATAAAAALGMTGSPAAEPPLIQALLREQSTLQVAAATALGRVGSVAAVLPLKEAAELFWDPEHRRAARQAIAEIQSRVQGASPGQLSLAGAEAGQLSLAQAEAGQLSLASDSAGRLSLRASEEET